MKHGMAKEAVVRLRAGAEEVESWKDRAKEEGVGLSEWIRGRCRVEEVVVKAVSRKIAKPEKKRDVGPPMLAAGCSDCGHPRHKHGGWGTACQEANCRCARYV